MVDGRVLPKSEADALRASVMELVATEALPKLRARTPSAAVRLLDTLQAKGSSPAAAVRGERRPVSGGASPELAPPRRRRTR